MNWNDTVHFTKDVVQYTDTTSYKFSRLQNPNDTLKFLFHLQNVHLQEKAHEFLITSKHDK
jgi:hypothetical protein